MNNRKLLSTILLFATFVGLLWLGLSTLTSKPPDGESVGESIVFALMLLGCAGYALVSILLLPRKKDP